METYAYGFPRIGKNREYKKLIEGYWKGEFSPKDLREGIARIEKDIINTYKDRVNHYPTHEITLYDNMLDMATMIGLYTPEDFEEYYNLCRGEKALELTKWFNTNYHYLVPDFSGDDIRLKKNGYKALLKKHLAPEETPYFIGPFTLLKLSKGITKTQFEKRLEETTSIYREIIAQFDSVHIDEPALVMELKEQEINLIEKTYNTIKKNNTSRIYLFTYYDSVDYLERLVNLPVEAIGLDFVSNDENLKEIERIGFPDDKVLIAGVVNGRNVWKTDIKTAINTLNTLSKHVKNLWISNAGPLYHLPVTLEGESLGKELTEKLAFATEKLTELREIATAFSNQNPNEILQTTTEKKPEKKKREYFSSVRSSVTNSSSFSYEERREIQKSIFNLPLFPSTTIGSFPQTPEVRKKRKEFKTGKISKDEYAKFVKGKIKELIKLQEEIGLDVLVHGEFERSDMVEFFAEKLDGITTTKSGWIISYGTRCYRPPIIYSDISRPKAMTLNEITYAQSLTDKPVKGMLTGPITILAWSYVREDISEARVAYQIASALREEIEELEKAGIRIVQIDEPAFREKAPIKRRNWEEYFSWAVGAFNSAVVSKPETQIHTHMCYSEFGEIIEYINKMHFDVISIEATRSRGDIIEAFERVEFNRQIGLGVWDIHSPVVPRVEEMGKIVNRALKVIPKENFWINPDCGLKTRGWEETILSLKNLMKLVKQLREL